MGADCEATIVMSPAVWTFAWSAMWASTLPAIELTLTEPAPAIESPPLAESPAATPMIAGEESASNVIARPPVDSTSASSVYAAIVFWIRL